METRSYTVYKFQELTKEAKEKAIALWYEREDYPFLESELLACVEYHDNLKIFSDVKLSYSLSYSQGDGLSFKANIDLEAWLKAKKYGKKKMKVLLDNVYMFGSQGNQRRYSFASASDIVFETQGDTPKDIETELELIRKQIADYYLDICKKTEKDGYDSLEYRMNDKEFAEHCDSNEYMFLASGKMD